MQKVEFIHTTRTLTEAPKLNEYSFKARGRFAFMQRWAFRFLRWTGALHHPISINVNYERVRIDPKKVMEYLLASTEVLADRYHLEGKTVLVGQDEYFGLINMPVSELFTPITFGATLNDRIGPFGLTVKVVPWMSGLLVMP